MNKSSDPADESLEPAPSAAPMAEGGSSPQEIELRLAFAPDQAKALRAALDHLSNGRRPVVRRLVTTYFDTADAALAARGAVLRVRASGRSRRQTLKAGTPDDALSRAEWEMPVTGDRPEPARFTAAAARLLLSQAPGEFAPIFQTRIRRETRRIEIEGSVIEVALDEGALHGPPAEGGKPGECLRDVGDLELELVSGARAALYHVARVVANTVPLTLEPAAKSDRARWALAELPPSAQEAEIRIPRDAALDDALAATLQSCLAQCLGNLPAARDGRVPAGIHQLRVGLRRLRSVLWVVGRIGPAAAVAPLRAAAKRLADAAGPVRDWDVFLAETLPPAAGALPQVDWRPLQSAAAEARAAEHSRLVAALDHKPALDFFLGVGAWIERRAWRDGILAGALQPLAEPAVAMAAELLDPALRRVRKAGRDLASLDTEHRHRVRIRLKRLRYIVAIFRPLFGADRSRRFRKMLSHLQDDFGHLNDAATTGGLLDRLLAGSEDPALHHAAGTLRGWVVRDALAADDALIRDWHRFIDTKPFWR